MSSFLASNAPFVIALVSASCVVLALALLAQRLVRPASWRHAIVLAALLASPVLAAAAIFGVRMDVRADAPGGIVTTVAGAVAPANADRAPSRVPLILGGVWLAGVVVSLARMASLARRWRGIARRAERITDYEFLSRFDSHVLLARSSECAQPTVIGFVDPVVVLPAGYELTEEEMSAVFAHELAHVERRDNLIAFVVQLVCALFWFEPLHRIARRKLVELRERVCDELVLERGCDAQAYARALARSTRNAFAHQHAVACMSSLRLRERMESIMSLQPRTRPPAWVIRTLVIGAIAVAAITFGTFAPAPAMASVQPGTSENYDFDVKVTPHPDGRFTVVVRMNSPEGDFTSAAVILSAPRRHRVETSQGPRNLEVIVDLNPDGSAFGRFNVFERETNKGVVGLGRAFPKPVAAVTPENGPPRAKRLGETPGIIAPKVISRVEPEYNAEAKAARIAGVCILEALIDEEGNVADVRVLKPLPMGLAAAAAEAVRQWKFAPAMLDGKPVAVIFNLTIHFKAE